MLLFLDPSGLVVGERELIRNGLVVLRVDDGPGFLVFQVYNSVLVAAGVALLLVETRQVGPAYYPQAALLTLALLTPIVFSALTVTGTPPFTDDRINLVPTSAAVSTVAIGVLLVRYRLFDLPPLAYATAMRYSPDGLFVLDRDERIVHANDRGHELLDRLDSRPGDRLEAFDPAIATGELLEIPSGTDESAYFRLLAEPLRRGGHQVGWAVILRDETAQQRQQQQLRRRNDQLETFATTVSHDLRNPLSVAEGYLELVREGGSSEDLDRIETAHTRMEEIIDRLLVLARSGERIDDPKPVALDQVAHRAWENVDTASATLVVGETCTVSADRVMLQHVFENLFRNAVEHAGAGVQVTVDTFENGFFVADDGPGIPEQDSDSVFDTGYSTSSDGTGLGLQIVRSIADAHGWEVAVTDATGGGARFEFTRVDTEP